MWTVGGSGSDQFHRLIDLRLSPFFSYCLSQAGEGVRGWGETRAGKEEREEFFQAGCSENRKHLKL